MAAIHLIPITSTPHGQLGLPEDYASLTDVGQRLARVNACRQHLAEGTSEEKAVRFVRALHFFDRYYLTPELDETGDTVFNPFFYDQWLPSPGFHDYFSYAMMRYKTSAGVGPRGLAKSQLFAKEALLLMLAEPAYKITYTTSTDDLAEAFGGEKVKPQIEFNPRVNDDWAPEYGGNLKLPRGSASWGMSHFVLSNRSSLYCTSAGSRQRGLRPRLYQLDDPEYDATNSTSTELLRQNAERLIFNLVLPMVSRAGARVAWRGTFVSKQHYLWAALQTQTVVGSDGVEREEPLDKRFGKWNRVIVRLILDQPDGTKKSAWPHQHPIDEAEKRALGVAEDTETVPEVEERLGTPVFQAEMQANPGDAGISFFGFDPHAAGAEVKWGHWYEAPDEHLVLAPWKSSTLLCYYRNPTTVIRIPLKELRTRGCRIYMNLDTSWTNTTTSDFKAFDVKAVTPHGEVLVLDLWAARCGQSLLIQESLRAAERWRAEVMYPEAIDEGATLVEELAGVVRDNAAEMLREYEYLPSIIPYNPGSSAKESRIAAALKRRFEVGLIKFPLRTFNAHPWAMLSAQITGFNPYARDGGLANDDCLNVVGDGCSSKILKGLPPAPPPPGDPRTHVKKLLEGEKVDPKTGIPTFILALPELTGAEFSTAVNKALYQPPKPSLEHQLP